MSVTNFMRKGESFLLKDEGLKGFVIESEDVDYYCELTGCPYVRFSCFDDYSKFFYIDCWLHFLHSKKFYQSPLTRNVDERMFYNILKEMEKLVNCCKEIKMEFNQNRIFYSFFEEIGFFIREYDKGFKHKNKKIERKFNKVAKDLKKLFRD